MQFETKLQGNEWNRKCKKKLKILCVSDFVSIMSFAMNVTGCLIVLQVSPLM